MDTNTGLQQRVTLKTDLSKLFAEVPAGEALALAQSAAKQMQAAARDLKREKVRSLGDGEAFVRLASDGRTVHAVKQMVPLSDRMGHFYCIPGWTKDNGEVVRPDKWKVSAEGYTWINKFAGVSTLTPPMQVVDGKPVENPYIATDPKHPTIMTMVHVRVVALGRTAVGSLVAVDYHLRWDPVAYLIETLKAVQEKNPRDIRDVKGSIYQRKEASGEADTLIFLPYAPAGFGDVLGLECDLTSKEVRKKLKDYQQLVKFGERRARTICVRNALRHHPAIAVSTIEPEPVWSRDVNPQTGQHYIVDRAYHVPVWAWVEGPNMLEEQQAAARAIMQGAPLPDDLNVQTVHADNELVDDEDGTAPVPSSVADAEIVAEDGELPPEPPAESNPSEGPAATGSPTPEEQAEILRREREEAEAEAAQRQRDLGLD